MKFNHSIGYYDAWEVYGGIPNPYLEPNVCATPHDNLAGGEWGSADNRFLSLTREDGNDASSRMQVDH